MTFSSQKTTVNTQRGELPLLVLLPLVLTILIGLIGWYGLASVERTLQEHAKQEIQNSLNAAKAGLHLWAQDMRHEVESWLKVPEVQSAIISLARQTSADEVPIAILKASREFTQLRTL